jgi:hypothetical protein
LFGLEVIPVTNVKKLGRTIPAIVRIKKIIEKIM